MTDDLQETRELALADALVDLVQEDAGGEGSTAITFWGDEAGDPDDPLAVVLVATDANPERLAELRAIHDRWFPE